MRNISLKVYGTTLGANSEDHAALGMVNHVRQIRAIVAAKSMAEALRLFGLPPSQRDWVSPTGNEKEIELAMSRVGQIFARDVNKWNGNYIEISRNPYVAIQRHRALKHEYIETPKPKPFTREELEYLRDFTIGANNPVAAAIHEKCLAFLKGL